MTVIAFTADWHVDEYGARVDPESGLNLRLLDFLRTASHVGLEARRYPADALVIAGDLTERRHPSPWLVARIQEAIGHGPSQVVIVRGNHDGSKGGRWIGDVLARQAGWDAVDRPRVVPVGDGAICALGYLDRHFLRTQPGMETVPEADVYRILSEQFLTIARGLYAEAKDAGAKWVVLVCHQTLSGGRMSDSQQAFLGDLSLVVDSRALQAIGFEAVVAGHLHRHQEVLPALPMFGTPEGRGVPGPVLYAGSIERVDFGEAEETKGFIVADVGPGRFEWEFVETPARRFVTLTRECGYSPADVAGAVVRCIDVDPQLDPAHLRDMLEGDGAFEVTEIRRRPVESAVATGGMSEGLSAEQALDAYFADEPDGEVLVERGRGILAEVAG